MGNQIKGFNCRSACGYEGDFGDFPRKKTIQDFNPELIQKNNNDSNSNDLSMIYATINNGFLLNWKGTKDKMHWVV